MLTTDIELQQLAAAQNTFTNREETFGQIAQEVWSLQIKLNSTPGFATDPDIQRAIEVYWKTRNSRHRFKMQAMVEYQKATATQDDATKSYGQ